MPGHFLILSISIRFESSGSGFRLRTVDCTVRIPASYSGLHCLNSSPVQWIALYGAGIQDQTIRSEWKSTVLSGGATGLLNKGGGSNRLPSLVTKQQADSDRRSH